MTKPRRSISTPDVRLVALDLMGATGNPRVDGLPSEQRRLLFAVLAGATIRAIAEDLGISRAAARAQVTELFEMFKVEDRSDLLGRLLRSLKYESA